MDDMELVERYARDKSDEAFAALVSRHVNLVYSVALRHVHDTHLAEEITQTVFVILARKAGSLHPQTIVPGWLCRTARYASARAITAQVRRQHREQEAYMRSQPSETEAKAWNQIEPLLETAMAGLGKKDHDAVVLRFLEGQSFKEISTALATTEAGAKMRVNRALEKLRGYFNKRGITFSAAVIAASLSAHSVQAAPAGLAASVALAATKGISVPSTLTLIKSTLKIMTWTKIKTAAVVGIVAILALGTATIALKKFKPASPPPGFKFMGYATPESAVESMLWTADHGEPLEKLADGITPDQMTLFRNKMAGKSEAEIRQGCITWANSLAGYQITGKDVISDDEVHLHIHAQPSADGLHTGHTVLIMKKVDGSWKFAGNA